MGNTHQTIAISPTLKVWHIKHGPNVGFIEAHEYLNNVEPLFAHKLKHPIQWFIVNRTEKYFLGCIEQSFEDRCCIVARRYLKQAEREKLHDFRKHLKIEDFFFSGDLEQRFENRFIWKDGFLRESSQNSKDTKEEVEDIYIFLKILLEVDKEPNVNIHLSLSWISLTFLPQMLGLFQNIVKLELSSISFKDFPNIICLSENLQQSLQTLILQNFQLSEISPYFGSLTNLIELNLYGSKNLCKIPRTIGQLRNLNIFIPDSSHQLHYLPFEILDCPIKEFSISSPELFDHGTFPQLDRPAPWCDQYNINNNNNNNISLSNSNNYYNNLNQIKNNNINNIPSLVSLSACSVIKYGIYKQKNLNDNMAMCSPQFSQVNYRKIIYDGADNLQLPSQIIDILENVTFCSACHNLCILNDTVETWVLCKIVQIIVPLKAILCSPKCRYKINLMKDCIIES